MFKDKDFVQALFNTFKLMLVIPALTIFLSLVFAFILTQGELREKSFYRTVFFFPSVVSMTVVGITSISLNVLKSACTKSLSLNI